MFMRLMSARPVAPLTLLLACLTLVLAPAGPAGARGAEGAMTVIRAEQTGPGRAEVELGLLYANDNEVAEEATVTVTATGPGGEVVGPVPAPRTTGARYLAPL